MGHRLPCGQNQSTTSARASSDSPSSWPGGWFTEYSAQGDWVLDPFCGYGTTLVAAQQLGRRAIGFEKDSDRGHFAAGRVELPSRVIIDDARHVRNYSLPRFDLLLTSPPYTSLRGWDAEGFASL